MLGLSTGLVIPLALSLLVEVKTKPQYYWFLGSDIVIGGLLIATLYFCLTGFRPCDSGGITPPSLLMNENYYDSDEYIRLIITKTSIEGLKELECSRDWKASVVSLTIKLFLCTIVCEIIGFIGIACL